MKKRLLNSIVITTLLLFSCFSSFNVALAANDKKTGEFNCASENEITGYAGEPGQGGGQGNTVAYIDVQIKQNSKLLSTIKVETFNEEILQGKKKYYFSIDMKSKWPTGFNKSQPFELVGYVYKKANDKKEQYTFSSNLITFNNSCGPVNTASLDFEVNPTKEYFTIDPETSVAIADINANILPLGEFVGENRLKPIDVIFVMDVSGSMDGLLNWKLDGAKKAAAYTIDNFKKNALNGDRFALITFNEDVKDIIRFNSTNQNTDEIGLHLDSIKTKIKGLKDGGGTNYHAAFTKAYEFFDNGNSSKYIIFLTDGKPENGPSSVVRNVDGMFPKAACLICKKDYIKQDNVTVNNNGSYLFPFSIFKFDGKTYAYSKYETFHLAAVDAANTLTSKNVKIFSVGLGSWINSDKEFLQRLSEVTGASSYTARSTDELVSNFNHISELIEKSVISNIQVKIDLTNVSFPTDGHVSVPEESNAIVSEDGKEIILNIPNIEFASGKGTPGNVLTDFILEFDKAGNYTFNNVSLSYVDLSGKTQTITTSPLSIKILDSKSFGLKFKSDKYYLDYYDSTNYKIVDQTGKQVASLSNEVVLDPEPDPKDKDAIKLPPLSLESLDPNIFEISNGKVIPKGVGIAKIKVKATSESGEELEDDADLIIRIKGIEFKKSSYSVSELATKNLITELISNPSGLKISSDAIKDPITKKQVWKSSNEDVLKVVDGVISTTFSSSGGYTIISTSLNETYQIPGVDKKLAEAKTLIKRETQNNNKTDENTDSEW